MEDKMSYHSICSGAGEVVREAASYIRKRHEKREELNIKAKGQHNFVTEVDREAERILVSGLSGILPEAGFIAEEGTSSKKGERFHWVIDPLDGTTNFIHGVFPFAISVGLIEEQEVVAGVVYEFGLDEHFYAWKDGGAWLNGNRIRVSRVNRVSQALVATGFPYTDFRSKASIISCRTRMDSGAWDPQPPIWPTWPAGGTTDFTNTGSIPGILLPGSSWSGRQGV
jgi:myo-inositol-1(or 4)-monophosphatase